MPRQKIHRQPHTPREHALCILYKVENANAYAHVLLQQAYQDLREDNVSHALLTQLVKGTLEQRAKLDSYLRPFLKTTLEGLDGWTRNILRLGAYQVVHLNKLPVEVDRS